MNRFLNALGFQMGWWACVAGVGQGLDIAALVFCSVLVCVHLFFSDWRWVEIKVALIACAIGVVVDTALQYALVIDFYGWALPPLSPFWLWMLWVLFALTLNTSLAFLKQAPLIISALAGLVFGPLTYIAGAKYGAASFDNTLPHIAILGVTWMLSMPALVRMAQIISTQAHRGPP
jgi:Protein of unknown function (DUF2878)